MVSTAHITHATPAAFASHVSNRSAYNNIAVDYFSQSKPNLLLGGGANGVSSLMAENNGYEVVNDKDELLALQPSSFDYLSGQFGNDHLPYEYDGLGDLPNLSEMTSFALESLEFRGDYFFLLVEGARIDHACHNNDLIRSLYETIEFSNAVNTAFNWASAREDTLIIVTADHETGGLELVNNNGANVLPDVTWSTTGHTSIQVGVYAWGKSAEDILEVDDNTDFFEILLNR